MTKEKVKMKRITLRIDEKSYDRLKKYITENKMTLSINTFINISIMNTCFGTRFLHKRYDSRNTFDD